MTGREKLIDRVRKLMALAGNNPNAEEAQAAFCKAQTLLASEGMAWEEIAPAERPQPAGEWVTEQGGNCKPWQRKLCVIVARNYRCSTINYHGYRRSRMKVFGLPEDLEVATYVIRAAFEVAEREWKLFKKSIGGRASKAQRNAFLVGFCNGLDAAFKRNVEQNDLCPVLVVPAVVKEMPEFKSTKKSSIVVTVACDERASNAGWKAGSDFNGRARVE